MQVRLRALSNQDDLIGGLRSQNDARLKKHACILESNITDGCAPPDDRPVALSRRWRDPDWRTSAAVEANTDRHATRSGIDRSGVNVSWDERPGGRSLVLTREHPSRWGRSPQGVPGSQQRTFVSSDWLKRS
jgi:hypothetical protein